MLGSGKHTEDALWCTHPQDISEVFTSFHTYMYTSVRNNNQIQNIEKNPKDYMLSIQHIPSVSHQNFTGIIDIALINYTFFSLASQKDHYVKCDK
jgi:hypothetical protein